MGAEGIVCACVGMSSHWVGGAIRPSLLLTDVDLVFLVTEPNSEALASAGPLGLDDQPHPGPHRTGHLRVVLNGRGVL